VACFFFTEEILRMTVMNIEEARAITDKVPMDESYAIDVFPQAIHHDRFYDLEDYFLETYLGEFAEKIARIMIKLIHYCDANMSIGEYPECVPETEYIAEPYMELRDLPVGQIVNIIRSVVTQGRITLEILFPYTPASIYIRGGDEFSVLVYGFQHDREKMNLLKLLVEREGLFFVECTRSESK
jgi:hypothetical protein